MQARRFRSLLLLIVLGALAGCGSAPRPRAVTADGTSVSGPIEAILVSDRDFAAKSYQLLLDGEPSRERTGILVGVVRRQLQRSAARFDRGGSDAGLRALLGAFLLVRAGEHRSELLDDGERALGSGAAEVARLGQEGYAVALYSMLAQELQQGQARAEVEGHLKAIRDFSRSTEGGGPVESAGTTARVAVQRALLEASPQALGAARDALIAWIRRALDAHGAEQPVRSNVDRDEAMETYRALRGGPVSLVALYLRHGDPRGALSAIDAADLERLLAPELRDHLERAADERDPEAWSELYRVFEAAAQSTGPLDSELMAGAAWGAALELFRAEPGTLHGALPLAAELSTHGMAEVASLLLSSSLSRSSPPEQVGVGLAMSLNAIVAEDSVGQLDAARRTYDSAEKLLEVAELRAFMGKVAPSAARVRYVMAAIETRHGELDRARPLLARAIVAEPSVDSMMMLASLERQKGKTDQAIEAVDKVLELSRRASDALSETDALLQKFEILRDGGRADAAGKALDAALARAVEAQRQSRPGPSQARVERLLARTLEHYGEPVAIRRATERAYQAANGDVRQLAATVLDVGRRALTRGDLQVARATAQRAIDAGLGSDEMVYVAVWLQLVERKFNVPSDGTVEEAYATIDEASGWPTRLRAWGRGRLSNADLLAAAKDPAERTEAAFYAAMLDRAAGRADATTHLRAVASSPAVELIEVTIARDLVAAPQKYTLPASVALP